MSNKEAGPAPGGSSLTFTTECCTDPKSRFGTPHEVTILPDWTVVTPHDIDAERVAQALGAKWCSCIKLVDEIVPAYRKSVQIADPDNLSSLSAAQIAMKRLNLGLVEADRQLQEVHRASKAVWVTDSVASTLRIAEGRTGLSLIWDRGIHPHAANALSTLVANVDGPLPAQFFVDACWKVNAGYEWLREVIATYPDAQFASAAAGRHLSRDFPTGVLPASEISRLRAANVSSGGAVLALEGRLEFDRVRDAAVALSTDFDRAVVILTAWTNIGCYLSSEHCQLISTASSCWPPERHALDGLTDRLAQGEDSLLRTELAVMLALASPNEIVAAVRQGVRTAAELIGIRP